MIIDSIVFFAPAFVVGAMILFTHIILGQEVLKRGIIFVDLAIAQAVALGVVIVEFLHLDSSLLRQVLMLCASFLSAILFYWIEKKFPQYQEAMIGILYVMFSTISIFLLSHNPHGAEHFGSMLSGEIIFVSWGSIFSHFPIYLFIVLLSFYYKKFKEGLSFYLILAFAVTSSVQLVGVFLVFISLIVPALSIAIRKEGFFSSYILSLFALVLGLIGSIFIDYPSTACVILSLIIFNGLFIAFYRIREKK